MVLGYEKPVDIPVQSIYDTDMMKTYLGALQRDYEQGVKDFNDFRDKYGDFVSPIEGASDAYYNAGLGSVMNQYDALRSQGIDPIRSIEGRSALTRAINSVDRAKLATIRQSADNAKEYLKAVQAAKKDNNFDPLLEGISIVQSRGEDPSKYSEQDLMNIGNNPFSGFDNSQLWNRLGPEQDFDVATYWKPTLSAVKPETEEKDGYYYTGVKLDKLKDAVLPQLDRFLSTGRGASEYRNAMAEYVAKHPEETDPYKIDAGARDLLATQLASPYVTNDAPVPTEATRARYSRSGGGGYRSSGGNNNYDYEDPQVNLIQLANDESASLIYSGSTLQTLTNDLNNGTGPYSRIKQAIVAEGKKYSPKEAFKRQSIASLPHHGLHVNKNGTIINSQAKRTATWTEVNNALLNRAEDSGWLADAYAKSGLGGLYISKKSGGIKFKGSNKVYSPNNLLSKMCGYTGKTRKIETPEDYAITGQSYVGYADGAFHRYFMFYNVNNPDDTVWVDSGRLQSTMSTQGRVLQAHNLRGIGAGTVKNNGDFLNQ